LMVTRWAVFMKQTQTNQQANNGLYMATTG